MKRIVAIIGCFIFSHQFYGQSTNITTLFQSDLKKAESFYKVLAYSNALEFYKNSLRKNPTTKLIKDRIAECYQRLGNYDEAEIWLSKITREPDATANDYYQYGQVLCMLGQYDQAVTVYEKYNELNKDNPAVLSKIQFLKQLRYHLRDSGLYTITNQWYNSNQSDFAPHFYKNGIVFVSARDTDLFIKRRSLSALNEEESLLNAYFALDIYDSARTLESQVMEFYKSDLNSIYHDGPLDFFNDNKQLAFTRNAVRGKKPLRDSNGHINLELFFAKINENGIFKDLTSFEYNNHQYSIAHPWVSESGGLLLFSSDMPGGFGGTDIYYSEFNNGKWSQPKNMGSVVNTIDDESYPSMSEDSLLFFSSNGHGGFGGLDLFVSAIEKKGIKKPLNLSSPLNSPMDDFGMVMEKNGRQGFFSSNRKGGKGYDDIYKFKLNYFTLLGTVVDLVSKKPLPFVKILSFESLTNVQDSVVADQHGHFTLRLNFDNDYKLRAFKDGYTTLQDTYLSTHDLTIATDTIQLMLWSTNLFAKGIIYSNESQKPLEGATVLLENISKNTQETKVVGADGRYDFLLTPNLKYRLSASKPGFIPNDFRLNTTNIFQGELLNDMLLEEEFLEKAVILFDFDKHDIKEEFLPVLEKMVHDLNRLPMATLNIGAHADAQGTKEYNLKLSNARAKEVTEFFISRGISKKRIEAIGFGEELILNRCSEGVECTDEEHRKNRRAELKIQKPDH